MKQLFKAIRIFFTAMGVIFFLILIILAYMLIADPFNLKPLYKLFISSAAVTAPAQGTATKTTNPLLTPAQEQTLIQIGVDPAKLPTTITPQMEACFVQALGQARVNEIKSGSSPTPVDFFTARACL